MLLMGMTSKSDLTAVVRADVCTLAEGKSSR